jgi:RRXRR protein
MSFVLVVDAEHRPLSPTHPGHARKLLSRGKAAVWRRYPFTIILKTVAHDVQPAPLRVKLDPGSKTTGIALVNDATGQVVWAAELAHRGEQVTERLDQRRACRRSRRQRHTRYRPAEEFGYPQIQAQAKQPLRDAAAVNATRWALFHRLSALGLPLETGTGGRTKWNRTRRSLPKTHWTDAACVGASTPATLDMRGVVPLAMRATGRHSRQMCRPNAAGFPDKAPKATSVIGGFRTGEIVRAQVPTARAKAGVHVGRIAIRASGSCNITTMTGIVQGIHVRHCQPLHRGDGYAYATGVALPPQA